MQNLMRAFGHQVTLIVLTTIFPQKGKYHHLEAVADVI